MEEPNRVILTAFFHPTMNIPFRLDTSVYAFRMKPEKKVYYLIDEAEKLFEEAATQNGMKLELQINVIWNTKDAKKALNPSDKIGDHFKNGDKFGVYGEFRQAQAAQLPEDKKTPVTILTGFLGAGKTTLLNYILQEQREKKIAIIENEFGEVSIDDALLKEQKLSMAEQVIVMDNGCMCCTIRGDLEKGLKQILDSMHKGKPIDAIMIETTGMADPVPIIRTFMSNPELTQELRLDGVLCVADCKHLPARLDDKIEEGKVNEAFQQVAFSDKVLLNKIDLVSTEEAIKVKDRIRSINQFAKVVPAVKGRIPLTELSNMRAHDMVNFVNEDIAKEADTAPELKEGHGHGGHSSHGGHGGHGGHGEGHGDGHGSGHGHDPNCKEDHGHGDGHGSGHGHHSDEGQGHGHVAKKSRHDSRVNSFSVVKEGEIIPSKLSQWMQSLGNFPEERGTIFRIKAILAVKGHPYKHVFHAVMDVSDEDDAGPWAPGEKKISKIVFIGKSLDQKFLRDGFEGIFEQQPLIRDVQG